MQDGEGKSDAHMRPCSTQHAEQDTQEYHPGSVRKNISKMQWRIRDKKGTVYKGLGSWSSGEVPHNQGPPGSCAMLERTSVSPIRGVLLSGFPSHPGPWHPWPLINLVFFRTIWHAEVHQSEQHMMT